MNAGHCGASLHELSICNLTLHALALAACSSDRREGWCLGDTVSYTSSNRSSCLIALYKTCFLLTCRLAHSSCS